MIVKLRPWLIASVVAVVALVGVGAFHLAEWSPAGSSPKDVPDTPRITVSSTVPNSEKSFFPYFRLQREKVRSQQLELLKEIVNNPNTDDKSKQAALSRLLTLTNAMEMELKAEGLLKAQGFKEGVVILQEAGASVIISGPKLAEAREAQIKNQVAGVLKLSSDQVILIQKD